MELGSKEKFFKEGDWGLGESKSVRTNFRLTEEATHNLKYLAQKYSITYKELLDNIFQKLDSEYRMVTSGDKKKSELLDSIGSWIRAGIETKDDKEEEETTVRKTYVISKGSLRAISTFTNYYMVSRDTMVSQVINWFTLYYPEYADEVEHEEKTREAFDLISNFYSRMLKLHKKLDETLEDDPIVKRFNSIQARVSELIEDMELYLRDGKKIDSKSL